MRLTEEQKKEVVDITVDCYKYSKAFFTPYHELCGILEKLYNVQLPDEVRRALSEDNPGLVPPDIHLAVNSLLARVDGNLFSADPPFRCSAGLNTPEENIENATAFLKTASEKSELELNYNLSLFSAIKFACGVGYVDVKEVDLTSLKNNVPITNEEGQSQDIFYTDFVKDGKFLCPNYVPCNFRRFFPDPNGTPLKWAIYQSKATLLDLLNEGKYDFDVDKLRKTTFPKADFNEFFDKEDFRSSIMKDYNFEVELLHFRGWMPVMKDKDGKPKFADCIITVANRELLIQFDINDWHYPAVDSFILSFLFPNDMEMLYPAGKIEVAMGSFYNQFYLRNQRLINLDRLLNPTFATDDNKAPEFLQAEGGRIYKFGKGSKFNPISIGDISHKAYVEVDSMKEETRHVFQSNEWVQGIHPSRKESVYGISVLKEASDIVVRYENKIVAHTGLLKILNRYLMMGQLFLEKLPVKLESGDFRVIGKKNLFGDIAIDLKLNEAWNKPLQRQEFLQTVKLFQTDPFVDPIKLRRKYFTLMEFRDVEDLVPETKEKQALPERENMIMVQQGILVPVLPEDDDELHLEVHGPFRDNPFVDQHSVMHEAALQEKQARPGGGGRIPMAETEPHLMQKVSNRLQPKGLV